MVPALERAAGKENVILVHADTGAEDFSFFVDKVPGLFFYVGACPPDVEPSKAPSHHTPDFMIDEKGFIVGLKAMLNVTLEYMLQPTKN
jgi:amidohydrolase